MCCNCVGVSTTDRKGEANYDLIMDSKDEIRLGKEGGTPCYSLLWGNTAVEHIQHFMTYLQDQS